jgi:murein DD-endopeptidase MepM/ murein hydrolase activator NlpD
MVRRRQPTMRAVTSVLVLVVTLSLQVGLFRSSKVDAAGNISLRPPFNGTYRLTSFFDHNHPDYGHDNEVTIYTGESVADCSPHCYEGHPGIDWSMGTNTPVLAAAGGIVEYTGDAGDGYGNKVVIRHANGHRTIYGHFRVNNPPTSPAFNVIPGQSVRSGDLIGWSGNTGSSTGAHLHFGIYRGPCLLANNRVYEHNATDPFGWRGLDPDPMLNSPSPWLRHTASCLWRSRDSDPISCADTIVEDAGAGAYAFPQANWQVGNRGNGYHTYYRTNTATNYDYHFWSTSALPNPLRPGPVKVYVFVPEDPNGSTWPPRSQQVTYSIWTANDWQYVTVNQNAYVNQWVLLGTFMLADHGEVGAYAYTGEGTGTRWVMADAVKWRQYPVHLPLVMKDYPPCVPSYGQLITNGDFSTGDATGWKVSRSNGSAPIVQPYGGSEYGAWMGRYNSNQDQMYQFVCPAAPADWANFSFYWWMSTDEVSTTTDYDFLYVRVRDANGNLLQTLKTITNRSIEGEWRYEYFDLRAYAGQTIRISFEATTDWSLPTDFWIDDVSFAVYDW